MRRLCWLCFLLAVFFAARATVNAAYFMVAVRLLDSPAGVGHDILAQVAGMTFGVEALALLLAAAALKALRQPMIRLWMIASALLFGIAVAVSLSGVSPAMIAYTCLLAALGQIITAIGTAIALRLRSKN